MSKPKHKGGFVSLPWYEYANIMVSTHRLTMLVGMPGVGKTTYAVRRAVEDTGNYPEIMQGTPETELNQVWGMYTIEGGDTRFADGPLPRALKEERYLLVEEFNLIPLETRASLLALRESSRITNPFTGESIDIPEKFRLLATSNSENMSCQRNAAVGQALLDDFLILEVPELSYGEIRDMLTINHSDVHPEHIACAVEAYTQYHDIQEERAGNKIKLQLSYRSCDQMVRLLENGMDERQAVTIAMVNKYIVHPETHQAALNIQSLAEGEY